MNIAFDGLMPAVRKIMLVIMLVAIGVLGAACESPEERKAGYLASAEQLLEEGDLVKAEIEAKNVQQIEPKNPDAAFILAKIAEQRLDFTKMAQYLRISLEQRPDYVEARVKLGTLYALGGATDLAREQSDYLQENGFDTVDTRILQARVEAAEGDLEQARAYLESALELEPDNAQALGLLASITAGEDLDSALELLDRGIAVAENDKPLRLLRIDLLQQGGRTEQIDSEYTKLIEDYPDDVSLGYRYARYLAEAGRIDEVEPILRGVVEREPENIQARIALVQFVGNTRGVEAAEELLEEFVNDLPEAWELRMTLAGFYQSSERPDEAYEQYEYIYDAVPNEDEGLNAKAQMAGILLAKGEREQGKAMVDEVLAIDGMNSDALLLSGVMKAEDKDFRGAVSDFRALLRKEPDNLRAQLLLARTHASAGDIVLAKDAYRRALEMSPANGLIPMELARLAISENDLDEAEDVLRDRLRVQPGDARASRGLIAVLVQQELFDDAEAEAIRLGEESGQQLISDYLLGGVYQAQDEHEKAIAAFQKALDQAPTTREPLQGLVGSLVTLGRTDEAVAYLEGLTAEYPDNLYAKTLLGQLLAGSGDAVAAQQILESTLESNEGFIPAYTVLAGMQGDDIGAQIDIYRRGLEAMPGNQEMALLLGTAYERSGRIDDAIKAYEEILEVNPELPAVANNLAALLADYRDDTESFERALELSLQFENSSNPAYLDTLGWVYYRLGRYEEAVPLLEQAVEAAPAVAILRYHLGMAYLKVNKPTLAKSELEKALENEDIDFTGVEDAREALAEL